MVKMSKTEMVKMLEGFLNLANTNSSNIHHEIRYLRAGIETSQETDFFTLICNKEYQIEMESIKLRDDILISPLDKRQNLKDCLKLLEHKVWVLEILREEFNPSSEKNLRSAMHFIQKNLDE